jgi:2-dehydropantoate 2-reductase
MRHAVLGAGGIGGLLAGALARSGAEVVVLLRPATLAGFSGRLAVESVVLGDFEVELAAASRLDQPIDVLWVATKATQLESALSLASADQVGDAFVIPLLNGVDHLALLRSRYPNVVAAAIRVESERVSPGLIRQTSPFLRVEIAGAEPAQAALRTAGIECRARDDERSLLWDKLVFLAPIRAGHDSARGALGRGSGEQRFPRLPKRGGGGRACRGSGDRR